MKTKIIALVIACFTLAVLAYPVDQPWLVDTTTPHVVGTNTYYGDIFPTPFDKANSNYLWFTKYLKSGTNGSTVTVAATNYLGGVGTALLVTNIGTQLAAVIQFHIPQGAPGTNTVTAYNFTNQVLSSKEYQTYITNYAHWTGSNFLARVAGLSRFSITGGDDAGNPPQAIPISLLGSFTGTNAFFTVTNGYWTSNTISLWAISGLTNAVSGLPMVNPGFCALYSLDHWELKSRVNSFDGQTWLVNGSAIANQNDVQNAFNSAFNGNWSYYTDKNTVYHTIYSRMGQTIADIASATSFVPGASAGPDGTGTNFVMSILQTNLVAGYFVETITNLSVPNWLLFTNYTLSTNTGIVSFTIPINITEPMRAFRTRGASTNTAVFNFPIESNGGIYYPSNTWNLSTITNRMKNLSFWQGNSNGQAMVSVYLSNGVARIKQLAP